MYPRRYFTGAYWTPVYWPLGSDAPTSLFADQVGMSVCSAPVVRCTSSLEPSIMLSVYNKPVVRITVLSGIS